MKRASHPAQRGATLVETVIAAAITGGILGALVTGGISLQRTYTMASEYFRGTADQMLVSDYMASDLRCATGVSVAQSGSNQTLTVILPDYLDPATGRPRTPVVDATTPTFGKVNGTVDYGSAASPLSVTYSVSGQRLVRQAAGGSAILSNSLQSFQLSGVDQGTYADLGVTFSPRFSRRSSGTPATSTTVRSVIYMRNPQRY